MSMSFDTEDRIDEDGLVTIHLIPSNWHVLNMSPDTYERWNAEFHDEQELYYYGEETGLQIEYDDLKWEYDHAGVVRGLSLALMHYIEETLKEMGLTSITDVNLVESWSPREYNFTSDGFHMEFRCDPVELRELTPTFDVDEWAKECYSSRSGFISYVTHRMTDPDWRAAYDGEFRIESMFAALEQDEADRWQYALDEVAGEVWNDNTDVSPNPDVFKGDEHKARVDENGETVRYHSGEGWAADGDDEFYPDLLTYHREAAKLVSVIEP